MPKAVRGPLSRRTPRLSRGLYIPNGAGGIRGSSLAFPIPSSMPHFREGALWPAARFRRRSSNMNMTLVDLLDEHGDAAFPHAPDTGEELLQLFRMGKDGRTVAVDCLVGLVRSDPGFAFNLARLLHEDGMPLGTGATVDLRAQLEKFNAFRAVAILGPKERHADVFGSNRRLGAAYPPASAPAGKPAAVLKYQPLGADLRIAGVSAMTWAGRRRACDTRSRTACASDANAIRRDAAKTRSAMRNSST